jgi:hypothetical protein
MKSKRLGIILLLLVTTSTIHSAEIDSSRQCDCGFQDTNTESYWTEMWHRDFNKASLVGNQLYTYKDLFVAGYQIGPKYDRTFSRIFRKENVMIANETLELAVTVKPNNTLQNNEGVLCAGFGTKRYTYTIIINQMSSFFLIFKL